MSEKTSRRNMLKSIAAGSVAISGLGSLSSFSKQLNMEPLKGNINHSVCRWTYSKLSVEELCIAIKKIGFAAIDLVGPKDWPILKQQGVFSSMCNGAEINLIDGWNEPKFHDTLIKNYTEHISLVSKAGYKNLICFSGNRRGMDDETGLQNCVKGLQKILPIAEKNNVIIVMELLNSKVNHKDYMCDRTSWGAELCKRLGSENFKLLYDIYHMQVDEGNVIQTIKDNHQYIAHYHTAGVPGRHEIDNTQELYYPAIMKAIVETGFKGYVAQEFIPTGKTQAEQLKALKNAIETCDI
ncbi:MAG: hydroxypyruvate isomerase family protein [Niabella sp.]